MDPRDRPERRAGLLARLMAVGTAAGVLAASAPSLAQDVVEVRRERKGPDLLYLDVEGGAESVNLRTFDTDASALTVDAVDERAAGPMVGIGAGLNLGFLSLGPRARGAFFEPWDLYSVGGELGLRIPLPIVQPHAEIGAGYAVLAGFERAPGGLDDELHVDGYYGRVSGGVDFRVSHTVSVGAVASWELLGLTRDGLTPAAADAVAGTGTPRRVLLEADGSSLGSALALTGVLGLHY